MNLITPILTLAILAGQLIKLPIGLGGVTLLDAAIIIVSFYALFKLKFHLKKPPAFIILSLIFILIAAISLILTPINLQFSEYLISFLYIVRFAFYILFAWLIYSGGVSNFQKQISNLLVYSGVGLAILGLLQFIFLPDLSFLTKWGFDPHYFRTVSTFLDPNFAGAYFVLTLILLPKSRFPPVLRSLGMFIVYLALLTTFSRSSFLMFLVSGLTLSFLQKSKKMMIQIILLFLILLLGFQLYTHLVSTPRNINREESASYRLTTWQQGLTLFQKSPILGVGFNSYRYALEEFKLGDEQFLKSHGASSNDSSLLFVAATTGIIGFLIYICFLISLLRVGVKDNFILSENTSQFTAGMNARKNLSRFAGYPAACSGEGFILASSVLGLLAHSLFANSLFFPPILLWLMIISTIPKK